MAFMQHLCFALQRRNTFKVFPSECTAVKSQPSRFSGLVEQQTEGGASRESLLSTCIAVFVCFLFFYSCFFFFTAVKQFTLGSLCFAQAPPLGQLAPCNEKPAESKMFDQPAR